jgi:N-acetylmuramoyl-L-alanine amidase
MLSLISKSETNFRSRLCCLLLLLAFLFIPTGQVNAQQGATSTEKLEPAVRAAECDPENFKIAVDIGHTKEAPGATSARGESEFTFNMALARQIEQQLRAAGFSHTMLVTTSGLGRSQLIQRSDRANAAQVDLFMSVHHDDVQPQYYSEWQYEGRVFHFSDKFSGYSIFVSERNKHAMQSLEFAKLLGRALIAHGMHFSLHHAEKIPGENRQLLDRNVGVYRYDQLVVLERSTAPAILLEAGVIVNREEELVLRSAARQEGISEAVVQATKQFCKKRSSVGAQLPLTHGRH